MWNFQRIICIWICCVSCMFGTTQLSSLVQAVPYEYFDDHDQSFYDLDTEQIQAKYDTRLLSQQMLKTEEQQQQQNLQNKKDSFSTMGEGLTADADSRNILNTKKHNDATGSLYISTKLKSNDDGHHHSLADEWLEETGATISATSATSPAITEKEELHLPRAASCYTNGHKYTHGQKVPRLDSCEVCLCMDGEIFCWWEKCDKKPATQPAIYDDYSTRYEESSTTRMQLNPKTTYKTTLKPIKKPKIIEDYKYDDDDSAEITEMQQEYEGIKEQLMMRKQQQQQQHKNHNKQMVKKKIYQQHEEEKHNKKLKEQQNKKKQQQQQEEQQHFKTEQKQHKANDHHHIHNSNNNNHHDYGGSSGSSKILNFPENLPSVLYYDYKTEEHHQHQHQHHEQHLKHQKQKQQQQLRQHEKELKHRQQQKQQQQQQKHQQQHHVNRHHEYGQDYNAYTQDISFQQATTTSATPPLLKAIDNVSGPSTLKYFSNGNDNIYNVDLQTDSDILPEPPTKKPKLSTASEATTSAGAGTTTQPYRWATSTLTTSSTATITVRPLKKQNFSPWDFDKPNRDKINKNNKNNGSSNKNNNKNNNKNESSEEIIIDSNDDQDDAFHRWLTSTETNKKKNKFSNRDGEGGGGEIEESLVDDDGNIDYNIEDKNYENIDIDIEARAQLKPQSEMQLIATTAKTMATAMTTTTLNAIEAGAIIYDEDVKTNGNFENSRITKYEQNFNPSNKDNLNIDNNNDITNTNSNSNSNNNISPFSNPYQNNNNMVITSNNRHTISTNINRGSGSSSFPGSGSGGGSSTSNEDNGVANVVNIDIMLTASSAELQQQQQQQSPTTDIKTTHPQQHEQQQQQQHVLSLQDLEHEKQISTLKLKFVQPPVLISNTNDVDNNKLLSSITNNNSNTNTNTSNNNNSTTNIVGGLNAETTKTMGVNLLSINSNNNNIYNNNNSATSSSTQSTSDSFKFNHLSVVTPSTATNFVDAASTTTAAATPPPTLSTTLSPERLCNVMGTLYKIGDVLPQDTGNCLQCICIDGSTSDDTPRVTCSPHNCPPLVLPDLFDATGY